MLEWDRASEWVGGEGGIGLGVVGVVVGIIVGIIGVVVGVASRAVGSGVVVGHVAACVD